MPVALVLHFIYFFYILSRIYVSFQVLFLFGYYYKLSILNASFKQLACVQYSFVLSFFSLLSITAIF